MLGLLPFMSYKHISWMIFVNGGQGQTVKNGQNFDEDQVTYNRGSSVAFWPSLEMICH